MLGPWLIGTPVRVYVCLIVNTTSWLLHNCTNMFKDVIVRQCDVLYYDILTARPTVLPCARPDRAKTGGFSTQKFHVEYLCLQLRDPHLGPKGDLSWGCTLQGYYPKVRSRSCQGHFKVKPAEILAQYYGENGNYKDLCVLPWQRLPGSQQCRSPGYVILIPYVCCRCIPSFRNIAPILTHMCVCDHYVVENV